MQGLQVPTIWVLLVEMEKAAIRRRNLPALRIMLIIYDYLKVYLS